MSAQESNPWYRDAFRGEYLSLYTHRDEGEARELAQLAARVTGLGSGARVADIPCGGGRHMRAFSDLGWQVVGMDLSQELLLAAHQATPSQRSTVARGDIRHLPFPGGRFDLVTNVFTSLGYFSDDRENAGAVGELGRLLRPGGWLLLDFLDSAHTRSALRPHTTRTTAEGWHVEERRVILEPQGNLHQAVPRVRKTVRVDKQTGTPALVYHEEVALLDRTWFGSVLSDLGLQVQAEFRDYSGGEPQSARAPRLILAARKP